MGNFGKNKSNGQIAADTALFVTAVAILFIVIGAVSESWGLAQFGLVIMAIAVVVGIYGFVKR